MRPGVATIVGRAQAQHTAVPAFNIPYLPMMEPVVRALKDTRTFGLIAVARLEWTKFEAGGVRAVYDEYCRYGDPDFTRLHLDHVPVIDEDDLRVDFAATIQEAILLGYDSVMVDGSRLPLEQNIATTAGIVERAHVRGIAVEGELGAVLGHEEGPLPPYEELFRSGKGFTDPQDAERFARETAVDWLSVAIGSVHGAVSKARRDETKLSARLDIERLRRIRERASLPIVLHGGSGIPKHVIRAGIENGIAKINIGTAIRQAYERARGASSVVAADAVYRETIRVLDDDLGVRGTSAALTAG